jgi:Family of unknown function (DUF6459)
MPQPPPPASHRPPSSPSLRPPVLPLVPELGRPPREDRPLPDATSVRRLAVPDSAPPYDDEFQAAGQHRDVTASRPASKPATRPDGRGPDTAPDGGAPGRDGGPGPGGPERGGPDGGAGRPDGHRNPDGHRSPDGHRNPDGHRSPDSGWPGRFAQVLAETLAGSRPPRQIVPWTSEQARRHIRRLGPMLAAAERPLVRRVVASRPAADVVEMTVVVRFGPRVRALAVRLERDGPRRAVPGRDATPARWRCTAVEAA